MTTTRIETVERDQVRPPERRNNIPYAKIFYYLILAWFTIALLLPVAWLILASFKTNAEILSSSGFFPSEFRLDGYEDAFNAISLLTFFRNSLITSAGSTILVILVASMAAYPLSRFKFRFQNVIVTIFSLGIVIPITSLIVPEVLIMRELGLADSLIGLILLYSAIYFPISFIVMRAFFLSIPLEIEEAALIDGASYWTMLFRLIMPLSGPGISTIGVLVFVQTWNEFLYALLLISSEENRTVQIAIRFFQSEFDFNLPGMYAAITLVIIAPIIVFLILQERVVSGLTAGATKF